MTDVREPWASIEASRAPDGPFVDWSSFWDRDRQEAEWLLEQVLARGRSHAFYAAQKTGKSLVLLWAAACLATGPEPEWLSTSTTRWATKTSSSVSPTWATAPTATSHASATPYCQACRPSTPRLERMSCCDVVDEVQRSWPDHHVAVVIDTTSRAVAGDENSADTIRAFYRQLQSFPSSAELTSARVDHSGKDTTKGQRGSSAKGDDVDVIWQIERTDDGVVLKRDAVWIGSVPERVPLRGANHPLRYEVA